MLMNNLKKKRQERRWSSRKSLDLRVWLHSTDIDYKLCIAANINFSGLFILCNQAHCHVGDVVELCFKLNFDGSEKQCNLTTKVIRVGEKGMGAMFQQHDSISFRYIQKMLFEINEQHTAEQSKVETQMPQAADSESPISESPMLPAAQMRTSVT
jgi:hypothetical protein